MEWLPYAFVGGGLTVLGLITWFVVAVRRADRRVAERVRTILEQGESPQQALDQLIADRVDPKQATSAVNRMVRRMGKESLIALTMEALNQGTPEAEICERLTAKGLRPDTAANLVEELAHPPFVRRHPILSVSLGVPIMIGGCAVIIGSLIVRDGNLTGKWVTFPYAGLVTKLVGIFILTIGGVLTILPFKKPGFMTLESE